MSQPRRASPRDAAVTIIRRLRDQGHCALLAGGCVRDMLLNREPDDYDVATDAVPQRVMSLFSKTRQVGAQFGVVLVRQAGVWIEVATFRSDHRYEDGRHPVAVTFSDPEEDARRRDFTVNGMFYDPIGDEVIDYVGGQADLRAGLIRTIGNAEHRFAEDHLRLIRAVRFAARLQYAIEEETYRAVRKHAALISRVSAERVRDELEKILTDPHRARALRDMADLGLLGHLWTDPDWTAEREALSAELLGHLGERTSFALAMACMLIHWSEQHVNRVCRDLTFSNELRHRVVWLVGHRRALLDPDGLTLADLKLLMQHAGWSALLELTRVWLEATNRPLDAYELAVERARAIPPEEVAPAPLVDGEDLIALGLSPGPIFKRILDRVYREQLEGKLADRAQAMALALHESKHR